MSIYLSGSVGYTLLKYKNMHVLLFADIHDGIEYCKQNNSEYIASYLNRNSTNSKVLLEEIIREKFKLTELWPNAKHTQELKKLNQENQNIIPIDIRPMLIPFSWELVSDDTDIGNKTLEFYIDNLNQLFNEKSILFKKYFQDKINSMIKQQETNNSSKLSPLVHYDELKNIFTRFKNRYEKLMDRSIIYIKKHKIDALHRINNIISMIMEWYIVLLIHNDVKNTIIHVGLAHSNRLLDLLTKVYRFKIKNQIGINEMKQIPNKIPSACIMLPHDISNMYNRKYGFDM
jgi:hypothetical protein